MRSKPTSQDLRTPSNQINHVVSFYGLNNKSPTLKLRRGVKFDTLEEEYKHQLVQGKMTATQASVEYPQVAVQIAFKLPLYIYRLGWGTLINWIPFLVLTSCKQSAGSPCHEVLEYRRHGTKYYIVAARGEQSGWYQNIMQDPRVTIQHGAHVYDGIAHRVENPAEALRALYMFSRNSWVYETLFARMSSAQAADLSTLAEVVDEFTVVRIDPTSNQPQLPPVEPFSKPVRQVVIGLVFLWALWLVVSLIRRVINR